MPIDVFTDTPLVSISGPVTIVKDVKDGSLGSLTVAGIINASGGLAVSGSLTGVSLTAASALTCSTGLSITAGGITVTAGGLSITAGNVTAPSSMTVGSLLTASNGVSITAGGETVTGGLVVDNIKPGINAVAASLASTGGAVITPTTANYRVTNANSVLTATMATAGFADGQVCNIINDGASILSISGNVGAAITIAATTGQSFIFDSGNSKWVAI